MIQLRIDRLTYNCSTCQSSKAVFHTAHNININKSHTGLPVNSSCTVTFTPNEDEHQKSKFTIILLITCILAENTDFEISNFSNFYTSMTFTLIQVIQHTIVYHSSTSTYISNSAEIGRCFCRRRGGHAYIRTLRPALLD